MSRLIAIGDIHGCAVALEQLLETIKPGPEDTVIGLGDYVDRGMRSAQVLERLVDLVGRCRFVPLIGNHELMMFKGLRSQKDFEFWFSCGGSQTLASYGGRVQNIPQDHIAFLSHCRRFFETETHIFAHAGYLPELPMPEQPDEVLFWEHILEMVPPPHFSGKTVVVGHTPQHDGQIRNLGHLQILDTHCYGGGWLTALDVLSGTVWQANNEGEVRQGGLPEPEPGSQPMPDDYH